MQTTGSFLNKLVLFHEHLKEHSVKEPLLVFLYVDFMDKTRLTIILKCMIQRVQTLFFCNSFAPWSFSCSAWQPQSGSWHLMRVNICSQVLGWSTFVSMLKSGYYRFLVFVWGESTEQRSSLRSSPPFVPLFPHPSPSHLTSLSPRNLYLMHWITLITDSQSGEQEQREMLVFFPSFLLLLFFCFFLFFASPGAAG